MFSQDNKYLSVSKSIFMDFMDLNTCNLLSRNYSYSVDLGVDLLKFCWFEGVEVVVGCFGVGGLLIDQHHS
jgi:hypothetical protein